VTRPLLASDFNAKIDIRRPSQTDDGHGGYNDGWTNVAIGISAEATPLDGREAMIDKVLQSISVYRFRIRYRAGIRVDDQIRLDGAELNIRSAVDPDRRRRQLHIVADSAGALKAAP
jgi:SPP1 family predicted phage head-tail adaptor